VAKRKNFQKVLLLVAALGISQSISFSAHAEQSVTEQKAPMETPSAAPKPTSSPTPQKPALTPQQKSAIAAAAATYKASVQQALEGANRAVADAKSLLQQELAVAGKDKALRDLAIANFKKNTAQIWTAFRKSTAEAKSTFVAAVAAAKS
jgi:hypothetical protein